MQLYYFTYADGNTGFFIFLDHRVGLEMDIVKLEYASHGTRHQESFYVDF